MWNRTENQVKRQVMLQLIRHGETPGNQAHRYIGTTQESLSKEGREKLLAKKEKGNYVQTSFLFSSPMTRCLETVDILYQGQKAILIPEWTEMDFGLFEGKNYQELKNDSRYQAWIDSNATLPFPEGEDRAGFIQRCKQGFSRMLSLLLQETDSQNLTVTAIVHGGTIMALLSQYSGGDYFDYQVKNGEGYSWRFLIDDFLIHDFSIQESKVETEALTRF